MDTLAKRHPVPIRVKLNELTHVYHRITKSKSKSKSLKRIRYTVSGLIKLPFPAFDADAILKKMSPGTKFRRYKTACDADIKKQWREKGALACKMGTEMHAAIERFLNTTSFGPYPQNITPELHQFWDFCYRELEPRNIVPYRTELPICASDISLAGTVDFIGIDEENKYWLFDWKRTEGLKETANGSYGYGTSGAFKQLENVNGIHYSLQLHLYRLILARYYDIDVPEDHVYIVVFHEKQAGYRMNRAHNLHAEAADLLDRFDEWTAQTN